LSFILYNILKLLTYHTSFYHKPSPSYQCLNRSGFFGPPCIARKNFAHISPICREAPLGQMYIKFCTKGHLADVINNAKFYLNQIKGVDSVGVEFLAFP